MCCISMACLQNSVKNKIEKGIMFSVVSILAVAENKEVPHKTWNRNRTIIYHDSLKILLVYFTFSRKLNMFCTKNTKEQSE